MTVVLLITLFSITASMLITSLLYSVSQDEPIPGVILWIAFIVPSIVAPLASWYPLGLLIKVDALEIEMRTLATYDSLTGLLNRRAFLHDVQTFFNIAEREHVPFSVILLDLDNFKGVNDTYGHAAGDAVLQHFADTVTPIIRHGDLVGRVGGEEFALLLPNMMAQAAVKFTERLHDSIRNSSVRFEQTEIAYTVSMGLVSSVVNANTNIDALLRQADMLLYEAKANGKDRTEQFAIQPDHPDPLDFGDKPPFKASTRDTSARRHPTETFSLDRGLSRS